MRKTLRPSVQSFIVLGNYFLLFVGDVGRDRGVAEGIRFTGLVGRDSDDDRRTGLVFLERRVAKLNPQQKSPTGELQSTKH
jgi:hypothetical protein